LRPEGGEVVALMVGDESEKTEVCDIIVDHKKKGLQRRSELHPSYMSLLLIFGVPYIHWRRIQVQIEVLQASQIKHGYVQILCMIISRLVGLISRLGLGLVD